jgi:hypothetical protein
VTAVLRVSAGGWVGVGWWVWAGWITEPVVDHGVGFGALLGPEGTPVVGVFLVPVLAWLSNASPVGVWWWLWGWGVVVC